MKDGSVIVDIAVDQGGCVATIHPTTLLDPVYLVGGVVHYGVANMPALVPRTSTLRAHERHAPVRRRAGDARSRWRRARQSVPGQAASTSGTARSCIPASPNRSARRRRHSRRCSAEHARRDVRVQLPGVEGDLLSREAPGVEDARVLRGALHDRRDQRDVLSHAEREDRRRLGAAAPAGFTYVLKAPQRITHFGRLLDVDEPLRYFCDAARTLGDRLGPLLFQLPRTSRRRPIGSASCSRSCPTASGWPSSSATRAGSTTRSTRCCARATPRSASPTPRRARHPSWRRRTSATSGSARWSTPTTI